MRLPPFARMFLLAAVLGSAGFNACGPIISNNGFDLWCGDTLCSWDLEQGDIAKVPTWHKADYGVALVGPNVVLSQISDASWTDLDCVRFEALADVDPGATLTVAVDLNNDGTIDVSAPMSARNWSTVSQEVQLGGSFENPFHGLRFVVHKQGSGQARLAQLRAYRCK